MIDLRAARADPEGFRAALARKGAAEAFDELLAADERWRELETRASDLRAQTKTKGKPTPEQLDELRELKAELQRVEAEHRGGRATPAGAARPRSEPARSVRARRHRRGGRGRGAARRRAAFVLIRAAGPPRPCGRHGWIDLERAARVSGARFAYRVGEVALLELALYRFALDRLVGKGFIPVLPPVLVREEAMYGTGFLPTDEVNIYKIERDELYLTGTSEVALASFHMGESSTSCLAATPATRRTSGASRARRARTRAACSACTSSTRSRCSSSAEPGASSDEHERLLALEEELVQELGLPYRVVNVAAGDLGASAAKKYDIEAWFPGQQRYREITSTSNTTDYQARRLGIRFRARGEARAGAHAERHRDDRPRLIALLENFQDEGGEIARARGL